jgi:uncharacterized protein
MANIGEQETILGAIPQDRILNTVKQKNSNKLNGLRYPFTRSEKGYFSKLSDLDIVKSNLRQLILTEPGERVMLPDFGCPLRSLLFAPFDRELVSEMRERIERSVSTYLPTVRIVSLQVIPIDDYASTGISTLKIVLNCKILDIANSAFTVKVTL